MNETSDDPVDALYQEDPADFVARRSALVKSLKAEGDTDLAATLTTLRKPPRTAAALSEFARLDPGAVQALLDTARTVGASLRTGGAELRAAQSEYTSVVTNLVERAADGGGVTSDAMRERMRSTLLAAGAEPDGEVARQLSIGALRDDAEAPGFAFGVVGPLQDTEETSDADPADAGAEPARPRPRLRSVRPVPGPHDRGSDRDEPDDTDADTDADESAQLDAALRERERVAAERAEVDREATARREAMRHRRAIERDLARLERRATRLVEQADEAEAKAAIARLSADEALSQLEELRTRLDEVT